MKQSSWTNLECRRKLGQLYKSIQNISDKIPQDSSRLPKVTQGYPRFLNQGYLVLWAFMQLHKLALPPSQLGHWLWSKYLNATLAGIKPKRPILTGQDQGPHEMNKTWDMSFVIVFLIGNNTVSCFCSCFASSITLHFFHISGTCMRHIN